MGIAEKWGVVPWTPSLLEAEAPGLVGRMLGFSSESLAGLGPGSASRALGLFLCEMVMRTLDSQGRGEVGRGSAVLCETLAPAGWLHFISDIMGFADHEALCG